MTRAEERTGGVQTPSDATWARDALASRDKARAELARLRAAVEPFLRDEAAMDSPTAQQILQDHFGGTTPEPLDLTRLVDPAPESRKRKLQRIKDAVAAEARPEEQR